MEFNADQRRIRVPIFLLAFGSIDETNGISDQKHRENWPSGTERMRSHHKSSTALPSIASER
jgi:hypothetical protein